MAKTRMTNGLREIAVAALFKHAIAKLARELVIEERELADLAIRDILGADFPKLAKTPEGWLQKVAQFKASAGGWVIELRIWDDPEVATLQPYFTSEGYLSGYKAGRGLPFQFQSYYGAGTVADEKLVARLQDYSQRLDKDVRAQVSALRVKIKATVGSYSNLEALLADLPELVTLVPGLAVKAPVTALAVSVQSLMCDIAAFRGEERDGCCAGESSVPVPELELAA